MSSPDAYDPNDSVTDPNHAIRFFTDREHARSVFAEYLESPHPSRTNEEKERHNMLE